MSKINELFEQKVKVINIGLKSFSEDLKKQSVEVVHVEWRPPAGGNSRMISLLNKLKK